MAAKTTQRPNLSAVFFKQCDSACIYGTSQFFTFVQIRLTKCAAFELFHTTLTDGLRHRNRIAGISQPNNLLTEAALRQMVTRLANFRLVSAIPFSSVLEWKELKLGRGWLDRGAYIQHVCWAEKFRLRSRYFKVLSKGTSRETQASTVDSDLKDVKNTTVERFYISAASQDHKIVNIMKNFKCNALQITVQVTVNPTHKIIAQDGGHLQPYAYSNEKFYVQKSVYA